MWNAQQSLMAVFAAARILRASSNIRTASNRARYVKVAKSLLQKAKSSFLQRVANMDFATVVSNLRVYKDLSFAGLWLMTAGMNFYSDPQILKGFNDVAKSKSPLRLIIKILFESFTQEVDGVKPIDNLFVGSSLDSRSGMEGVEDAAKAELEVLIKRTYADFSKGYDHLVSAVHSMAMERNVEPGKIYEELWEWLTQLITGVTLDADGEDDFIKLQRSILKKRVVHKLKPNSPFSETFRATQRLIRKYEKESLKGDFIYGHDYFSFKRRKANIIVTFKFFNNTVKQTFARHLKGNPFGAVPELGAGKLVFLDSADNFLQLSDDDSDPTEAALSELDAFDDETPSGQGVETDDDEGAGEQTRESREEVREITPLLGEYENNKEENRGAGKQAARLILTNLRNRQLSERNIRFLLENKDLLDISDTETLRKVDRAIYSVLYKKGALTAEEQSYLYGEVGGATDIEGMNSAELVDRANRERVVREELSADYVQDVGKGHNDFLKALLCVAFEEYFAQEEATRGTAYDFIMKKVINNDLVKDKFSQFLQTRILSEQITDLSSAKSAIYRSSPLRQPSVMTRALAHMRSDRKFVARASKLKHLNKFVAGTPKVVYNPTQHIKVEYLKEFSAILQDSDRAARLEIAKHPLSDFSPVSYMAYAADSSSALSSDTVPAFIVHLKKQMETLTDLASLKSQYAKLKESASETNALLTLVSQNHELSGILDTATNQYLGSDLDNRRVQKFPDEILRDKAMRAIRAAVTASNDETKAQANLKRINRRTEEALTRGREKIDEEILARSSSVDERLVRMLAQGSYYTADQQALMLPNNQKAAYQTLKDLYIDLHLLDDATIAHENAKEKYKEDIEAAQAAIEAKKKQLTGQDTDEAAEELEALNAGVHDLNKELKKLYVWQREARRGNLVDMRRGRSGWKPRAYNGTLEEKKEKVRIKALDLIKKTLDFDPSALKDEADTHLKALEGMNQLRSMYGEEGLIEEFRRAKIYSRPTRNTLLTLSKFLMEREYRAALPSIPTDINADNTYVPALAQFMQLSVTGGLALSEKGRLYTPNTIGFERLDVASSVKDFVRAVVALNLIKAGKKPTDTDWPSGVTLPDEWKDIGDLDAREILNNMYPLLKEMDPAESTLNNLSQQVTRLFKLFTLDLAYLIVAARPSEWIEDSKLVEEGKSRVRGNEKDLKWFFNLTPMEAKIVMELTTSVSPTSVKMRDILTPLSEDDQRSLTSIDRTWREQKAQAKKDKKKFNFTLLNEQGRVVEWADLVGENTDLIQHFLSNDGLEKLETLSPNNLLKILTLVDLDWFADKIGMDEGNEVSDRFSYLIEHAWTGTDEQLKDTLLVKMEQNKYTDIQYISMLIREQTAKF